MKCECVCHGLGDDRLTCPARGCCNSWAKGYRDGLMAQRGRPLVKWRTHGDYYIETGDNHVVAKVLEGAGHEERKDLTRRIVACLNACEGVLTEELETRPVRSES